MIKLVDILFEMYPPYKANMVKKTRYKASDVWTNDPETIEELITNTKIICDNCGWSWKKDDGYLNKINPNGSSSKVGDVGSSIGVDSSSEVIVSSSETTSSSASDNLANSSSINLSKSSFKAI